MRSITLLLTLLFSLSAFAAWEVTDSYFEVPKTSEKSQIQKALFNDAATRNHLLSLELTEFLKLKVLNYQMQIKTVEWKNDESCNVESPVKITNMIIKVDAEYMLTGQEQTQMYNYQTRLRKPCHKNYKVNI